MKAVQGMCLQQDESMKRMHAWPLVLLKGLERARHAPQRVKIKAVQGICLPQEKNMLRIHAVCILVLLKGATQAPLRDKINTVKGICLPQDESMAPMQGRLLEIITFPQKHRLPASNPCPCSSFSRHIYPAFLNATHFYKKTSFHKRAVLFPSTRKRNDFRLPRMQAHIMANNVFCTKVFMNEKTLISR